MASKVTFEVDGVQADNLELKYIAEKILSGLSAKSVKIITTDETTYDEKYFEDYYG